MEQEMPFVARARSSGDSLVVSIPKSVRELLDVNPGDAFEFRIVRRFERPLQDIDLVPCTA